ncbi:imidazolonepropionase [Litoribacter ruber]|uniref:imidazolonepropionase n=1 Tax=Litoribacter ruber TaxID=702568 RepID=UPI001BDB1EE8|nr:imidazolonepropionase [Litoribacter ruber]MBT0812460.1 imidazolonepropionase [Litoribacter ruber]
MLIKNIKELFGVREETVFLKGKEMDSLPSIKNAFLRIEGDTIVDYGQMEDLGPQNGEEEINAEGQFILPAWCDSHTHLVFDGSREEEFVDKIKGVSYEEIARKGGGILNSAKRLQEASEDSLYEQAWKRLQEVKKLGTGAIEIKSGYGLTVDAELKMLRVIKRLKENADVEIKATFLGAHAYPMEYKDNHQGYLDLVCKEMMPKVAQEGLAEYVDMFCEAGFFGLEESQQVIDAAKKYGLKVKLHANQLQNSGGVQLGVKNGAVSVDHLECMGEEEIEVLRNSDTIPTLLPFAAFFLRFPFQPARKMIDAGLGVALATDYNPGSAPSGNIPLMIAMSCIQMKMTPEEAINAATINGAFAMGVEKEMGSITKGKKANLIFTKPIPSLAYLPYAFGSNSIDKVMIKGRF